MWDEVIVQLLYTDHSTGGAAPRRHKIAERAYTDKIRARHEAEQRAATTGALTVAMSRLWGLTRVMFARVQSQETPARRSAADFPA